MQIDACGGWARGTVPHRSVSQQLTPRCPAASKAPRSRGDHCQLPALPCNPPAASGSKRMLRAGAHVGAEDVATVTLSSSCAWGPQGHESSILWAALGCPGEGMPGRKTSPCLAPKLGMVPDLPRCLGACLPDATSSIPAQATPSPMTPSSLRRTTMTAKSSSTRRRTSRGTSLS